MKITSKFLSIAVVVATLCACVAQNQKAELEIPNKPDGPSTPKVIIPAIASLYMTISPEDLNLSAVQCLKDQKYKSTSEKVSVNINDQGVIGGHIYGKEDASSASCVFMPYTWTPNKGLSTYPNHTVTGGCTDSDCRIYISKFTEDNSFLGVVLGQTEGQYSEASKKIFTYKFFSHDPLQDIDQYIWQNLGTFDISYSSDIITFSGDGHYGVIAIASTGAINNQVAYNFVKSKNYSIPNIKNIRGITNDGLFIAATTDPKSPNDIPVFCKIDGTDKPGSCERFEKFNTSRSDLAGELSAVSQNGEFIYGLQMDGFKPNVKTSIFQVDNKQNIVRYIQVPQNLSKFVIYSVNNAGDFLIKNERGSTVYFYSYKTNKMYPFVDVLQMIGNPNVAKTDFCYATLSANGKYLLLDLTRSQDYKDEVISITEYFPDTISTYLDLYWDVYKSPDYINWE